MSSPGSPGSPELSGGLSRGRSAQRRPDYFSARRGHQSVPPGLCRTARCRGMLPRSHDAGCTRPWRFPFGMWPSLFKNDWAHPTEATKGGTLRGGSVRFLSVVVENASHEGEADTAKDEMQMSFLGMRDWLAIVY